MGRVLFVACTNVGKGMIEEIMNNENITKTEIVGVVNINPVLGVSKANYFDYIDVTSKYNIPLFYCNNINDPDCIEWIKDKNPDLIQAVKKGIPCLLYTEALGSYSSRAYSCGICGVHGKTSTTGITGTILKELPLPSQVLAGSIINSFGQTCTYTSPLIGETSSKKINGNNIFVAETCEYQRHFMSFCPQKIILTSVEPDHQDYYPTYEDIRQAFIDYICKLPEKGEVIYCADDKGACDTVNLASKLRPDVVMLPYGEKAEGDYKLTFGKVANERNNFKLACFDKEFALSMPGRHEVLDAAAAVALCCQLLKTGGLNPADYAENIAKGLLNFSGGKRRSEIVGKPLAKMMLERNATITLAHSHTKSLWPHIENADLIVSAVGKIGVLNCYAIDVPVVDVGINFDENGKMVGDCINTEGRDVTPVPGGVGLLTRLALMENLLKIKQKEWFLKLKIMKVLIIIYQQIKSN